MARALLLLSSALLLMPLAAGLGAEEPRRLFVGERLDGSLVMVWLDDAPLDHETLCGGVAPLVSACSSSHTPYTEGIGHGFVVDCVPFELPHPIFSFSCFAGHLASTLNGGRTFRCDYIPGLTVFVFNPACIGQGAWPAPGEPIEQRCTAQTWAQAVPSGPAAGTWRCQLQHY